MCLLLLLSVRFVLFFLTSVSTATGYVCLRKFPRSRSALPRAIVSGIWRLLTQTKEANGTGTHLSRKPSHITPSLGKDDRGGPEEPARARQTSANSLSRWPHPSLIRSGPIRTCQPQQRCEREPGRAVGQITRADIIDDGEWYDVKVPDGPHHKNLTKVLNPNPDYSYP